MKELSAVLVNLQNPREKVWGILLSVQASGITVRGIDLNSFEDWCRSVARGESEMGLSTVFFPIHRVERIHEDETVGAAVSLAETFEARVGQDVWRYLGLTPAPSSRGREAYAADAPEWMSLAEAERDYIARVLENCGWDPNAAAEILDVSRELVERKIETFGLGRPD